MLMHKWDECRESKKFGGRESACIDTYEKPGPGPSVYIFIFLSSGNLSIRQIVVYPFYR